MCIEEYQKESITCYRPQKSGFLYIKEEAETMSIELKVVGSHVGESKSLNRSHEPVGFKSFPNCNILEANEVRTHEAIYTILFVCVRVWRSAHTQLK